jgi:hypothetical protein
MQKPDRINSPYCLHRKSDGTYLVLNRQYTPVGNPSRQFVDYEQIDGIRLTITEDDAERLSWDGNRDVRRIYLFNDGCPPWAGKAHREAYKRRLAIIEESL